MNTIVSLYVAKLLKEKGFNEKCWYLYTITGLEQIAAITGVDYTGYSNEELTSSIAAPTIGQTVMWLYNKHGIWIEVYYDSLKKEFYTVWDGEEYKFNSPTEAYEAVIEYCLKQFNSE